MTTQSYALAHAVFACAEKIGATVLEADDMAAYAAEYAAAGWEVLPLRGKIPAIPKSAGGNGVLDASCDPHIVAGWWSAYPQANIGLRVAPHVIVIDTDPRHGGGEGLGALIQEHGPLPATLTAESGRGDGGKHYYLRRPFGRLTSRHLPAGVDLKTSRGYVVAPPSIHPDSGQPYRWADESPIADPPAWLADLLTPPPPVVTGTQGTKRTVFAGESIADQYSANTTWGEILTPHGWTCSSPDPEADGAVWLHPAATSSCSATIRYGCLFVYSTNTPLPVTEPGSPAGLTKFRAYALLNHAGDLSAAARALKGH